MVYVLNNIPNKILVLGASGFVGSHLLQRLRKHVTGTFCQNPIRGGIRFDSLKDRLAEVVPKQHRFTHGVIFIGEANPDVCFQNPKLTYELNVRSMKRIVCDLEDMGIVPVFISSEFVFDGKKGDYKEMDTPNPILVYGQHKLETENFIRKNIKHYIIIRLAKTFGNRLQDKTLFTRWIQDYQKGNRIRIAYNQRFSPIWVYDAVDSINALIDDDARGIYNIAGFRGYSRLELFDIFRAQMKRKTGRKIFFELCQLKDLGLPEPRPIDVSLDSTKIRSIKGVRLHEIEDVCRQIIASYYEK
ncbi:hypothetical protein A2154_03100 [Candidatus Gottesmanbacteria bacterium RBG_16_43_7]|uniref:RmlD-like substrate binding domain-containing protein n=1 Tax=Candidatus Gottesmanbacteria bacterium RBG_16_43_7 TaxID=1798373 RepID=A0A1F5ZB81_9BACT|nr:MAG: hypothetical protein A2154_03100 [Candidatus Gottesmanbacteria bacterium RBG_16_43_7]